MRLRTGHHDERGSQRAVSAVPPARPKHAFSAGAIAAGATALCTIGTLGILLARDADRPAPVAASPVEPASFEVASVPTGAAIFVAGEPTGLTTPATLSGIAAGNVALRVELAGYAPEAGRFDVRAGELARHTFALREGSGQVALAGLPAGAAIVIAGEQHPAGEVLTLPAGKHELQIVLGTAQLVRQTIETSSGHQVWELRDRELVKK